MRLHVVRAGTGEPGAPPIVFVHGLGSSAATWARCMEILGQRHEVVAVDLLGHGDSPVPDDPDAYSRDTALADLDDVLASLDEPAVLVGHSLGGYLSLAHAVTRTPLALDANGEISAPDAPGLGIEVALDQLAPYLRTVDISVDGTALYASDNSAGRAVTIDA